MKYEEVILKEKDEDRNKKEIRFDEIEPINFCNGDLLFKERGGSALFGAFDVPRDYHDKIVALSSQVDWTLKKYKGRLYLIALKKDC